MHKVARKPAMHANLAECSAARADYAKRLGHRIVRGSRNQIMPRASQLLAEGGHNQHRAGRATTADAPGVQRRLIMGSQDGLNCSHAL